ncbi:hypothetical protein CBS63078_9135 [Aspergillus niger]|uniref:Contig An14c0170, genomic contig n=3 Tax=Aspergillus niger TaxID=5061 RepID=A2R3P2_ASPNC|nr:uncharacterized protein An14g04990 [Aspergillus niger]XP_025448574.1 uncharacterized protein BO96DRAFT_379329 [Aspergillus niger CBS 101883]RDH25669.1 hypothetical protein M747DRAFT_365937 [Aspergillus niger ATCC 13496]KAI2817491.1 hypothetical protein CBS115989_5939 [Aspergillus niger]KAI2826020.1 hypothetical protein CBS133816_7879 [Aspergillus niger]KAI2844766.1 hypothetical protein CBS11350_4685 [Aspergillus niger]KAI2858272.1 hypothetical protein CBS11232_2523 [Aspergillus niger]|eukprot:XP_001401122.1 hypothetical protein ANI_1_1476124 [Aspergillus niger CBS 513.88]
MSFKSKDLAYEAKQPAFLQRLKNQYGDTSGRLERPIARPRKPRDDNDDDAPTYVDEESNEIISKEEYEALVRGEDNKDTEDSHKDTKEPATGEEGKANTQAEAPVSKQNVAEIGGPRKRKQAKVVGEDNPSEETEKVEKKESGTRKPKQKKKIKLSFDDDDS